MKVNEQKMRVNEQMEMMNRVEMNIMRKKWEWLEQKVRVIRAKSDFEYNEQKVKVIRAKSESD